MMSCVSVRVFVSVSVLFVVCLCVCLKGPRREGGCFQRLFTHPESAFCHQGSVIEMRSVYHHLELAEGGVIGGGLFVSTGAARTINAFLKGNASGLCLLLTVGWWRALASGGVFSAWRIRRGEF